MTTQETWAKELVHWVALAARMQRHGQYNTAKVLWAAADGLVREAAHDLGLTTDAQALVDELERAEDSIRTHRSRNVGGDLSQALARGRAGLAGNELPTYAEMPDPYVCRRCGHTTLGQPEGKCPTCLSWPATYQRFRPIYWLRELDPFESLQRLRETPHQVGGLLEGLSEAVLNRKAPDGGWSVRETVSHLRDAQNLLHFRTQLILEQDNPDLASQAVWTQEAPDAATAEIFAVYRTERETTLELLEGVPLRNWWRTGNHEEFGVLTLKEHVSYFAAHEATHLRQIDALRGEA